MSNAQLPTLMQQYIHLSRYSRWLYDKNRRETWTETVARYFDFFEKHLKTHHTFELSAKQRKELEDAVLNLQVMPSMRCLMTAGEALERENLAGFNCCFAAIDNPRTFDEILYILMNGTGVGFSVEQKYIDQLPVVAEEFHATDTVIVVADSKLGWAKAYREVVHLLYGGQVPKWDTSKLRPKGAPLKTFGGRASGPEPLISLFEFTVRTFKEAAGRKLTSLECHDIVCKIADIVVVGGVRRSALISLSDLSDDHMRHAKTGTWYNDFGHRRLANNSYVALHRPPMGIFMKEWLSLYDSKSGERGIFSRLASKNQAIKTGRRDPNHDFGCNPCSEVILRNKGLCNLSEVVVRYFDTLETLKEKIRLATILGTFQSTLTHYKYVSKKWKENSEEERLLGVSLTGIMDNEILNGSCGEEVLKSVLTQLKQVAIETNKIWAKKLDINQSVSISCVKPSGTVSSLVDSAPGMHTRHAPYYIRTFRSDRKDPLATMMTAMGFPIEDDVTNPHTQVISFPAKSPEHSIFRKDKTALEQLHHWKIYQDYFCEHKPSITVTVKEHEWMEVGAWVYENFDNVSGVSFLPFSDTVYKQMPYTDCTIEEYEALLAKMPKDVDWSKLSEYENTDQTIGAQELACSSGICSI